MKFFAVLLHGCAVYRSLNHIIIILQLRVLVGSRDEHGVAHGLVVDVFRFNRCVIEGISLASPAS